jgi:hypothetical protein
MDQASAYIPEDGARSSQQHEHGGDQLADLNDAVANILMSAEELRRSVKAAPTTEDILDWRENLEHLVSLMDPLARYTHDAVGSQLESDLFDHCQAKVCEVAQRTVQAAFKLKEADPDDPNLSASVHDLRTDGQAALARMTELNLLLLASTNSSTTEREQQQQELVNLYVAYQRQVLRLRAKPPIASLVQARRDGSFDTAIHLQQHSKGSMDNVSGPIPENDERDDDDEGHNDKLTAQQYHAPVLADILGQAAALIHPLLMWVIHLPPDDEHRDSLQQLIARLCIDSIQTLNTQAQELVQTIATWFWQDRPMEEWMAMTTQQQTSLDSAQLAALDGLVEEMAFACQVLARYQSLFPDASTSLPPLQVTTLQDQLLPEFTWKYASLERYLAVQQWHSAVTLAVPVQIVMGTHIQVPSVVEDAQYLSTRALERAASTESAHAVGTVAHALSHDVWSTDDGGVYQALCEKRGCWAETASSKALQKEATASPPRSGFDSGFVSALMEALDDEEPPPPPIPVVNGSATRAPSSGNFLSSMVGSVDDTQQQLLDSDFCLLNGIHAASGGCRALVALLDTLLSSEKDLKAEGKKSSTMTQLAREDLVRFADAYQQLLGERIHQCIDHWCGSVADQGANWEGKIIPLLRVFFEVEEYNLNEHSFEAAEKDERLKLEMMMPLEESLFLNQLADKCESSEVLHRLGQTIVETLVELVLDVIWTNQKSFSDWGSLLLSKEIRLLQSLCSLIVSPALSDSPPPNLLPCWERMSQVICVLQLEKPADWLAYSSLLLPEEVNSTMRLRVDFSSDAVEAVVARIRKDKASSGSAASPKD